jgi:uncharacterized protein (DUF1330 family)
MQVFNELWPATPEQMEAMAAPGPDGPIYMVNLLKFRERAAYEDGRSCDLSGRDAYQIYARAVVELLPRFGGQAIFAGDVTHLSLGRVEDLWDEIAIARYPRRSDMVRMSMSAKWRAIAVHRSAGLAGQLNIETVAAAEAGPDLLARMAGA